MTAHEFEAFEYGADQSFASARYRLEGDERQGWRVMRDGVEALALGPGYRALRTRVCGVCSTDLARHFLPFPLPQVIGHEVVAVDDHGRRFVVEINAIAQPPNPAPVRRAPNTPSHARAASVITSSSSQLTS